MDLESQLINLKYCHCALFSITISLVLFIFIERTGLIRRLRRCPSVADLRAYSNLPIPKLRKDFTLSDQWFRIYERTMGTKDQEILKACLFYYVDPFMESKLYGLYEDFNYETIKSKFTFSYQI